MCINIVFDEKKDTMKKRCSGNCKNKNCASKSSIENSSSQHIPKVEKIYTLSKQKGVQNN